MAFQPLDDLYVAIDAVVHQNGPQGKTTASGLNSLLKLLAAQLSETQNLVDHGTREFTAIEVDVLQRRCAVNLPRNYVIDDVEYTLDGGLTSQRCPRALQTDAIYVYLTHRLASTYSLATVSLALYLGSGIYLAGHVGFRLRAGGGTAAGPWLFTNTDFE
jgi:hypothetical protein